MTCIVGLVVDGAVTMGCDSQATAGWTGLTLAGDAPKLFRIGNTLLGGTGDYRMLQIVQFGLKVEAQPQGMGDLEFVSTVVAEAIRDLLKQRGYTVIENSRENSEGHFLFGYRGGLYVIDPLYAVQQTTDGFAAIGSGDDFALGALAVLGDCDLTPEQQIRQALEVSARFSIGVSGPFHVKQLEDVAV